MEEMEGLGQVQAIADSGLDLTGEQRYRANAREVTGLSQTCTELRLEPRLLV